MCGRFVSTNQPDQIAAFFGAEVATDTLGANHNVAPTHDIYGVVADAAGERRVESFHWGLIPSWAKDRKIASKMINARSETLAEKPAFKGLFKKKRVLIPMDGFYEWKPGSPDGPLTKKGTPMKQPMYIHRTDDQPLAVAGLWASWKDPEAPAEAVEAGADWLHSATIVTTAANDTMKPGHDRMPVTVSAERWAEWLDPANDDLEALSTLFTSAETPWVMHEVSTDVNRVSNNTATLIEPIGDA